MNAPQEQNHIAEIIQVATGEMLKKDYANLIGVDPTRLSSRLPDDYARAIKKLQAEKIEVQSTCKQLQANVSKLQADVSSLKVERTKLQEGEIELQEHADAMQAEASRMQAIFKELQAAHQDLQAHCKQLESLNSNYQGQPKIIQWFGSSSTRAVLAVLLAVFEVAGTIHLLTPKGLALAVPVGVAMGYSLLAFASSGNAFGKWFCIVFSFAVGAIFFEPWVTGLPQDWLFAFVPPVVNAIIVNSFNQKK